MKVKFNNSDAFVQLTSYGIRQHLVQLFAPNLVWDLGGFMIYEDDEKTVVFDGTDYIYQWNVITEWENGVALTDSKTWRETPPDPNDVPIEVVDPLSIDELTDLVGELMFELSLIQLGLEEV